LNPSELERVKTHKVNDWALYRRLLAQARPFWGQVMALFALDLLSTPLSLLTPLPLKIVVDSVLGSDPLPDVVGRVLPASWVATSTSLLIVVAGFVVAIALATHVRELCASVLRTWTAERMVLAFRARLFQHVQRLSPVYHDTQGASDAAYRIQRDAPSIQYVAVDGVIPFVTAFATLGSMLYIIVRLDWQLSVVALTVAPVLFLASRFYRVRLRTRARAVKRLESRALGVVQEVMTSLRVVKAFGQEAREQQRFVATSADGMRQRIRFAVSQGGMDLLVGFTTALGTAVILYLGTRHVLSGTLTLGELLLVMSYLAQLYAPMKTISKKVASLQAHLASAERAFSLLDESPDVPEKADALPLARARGHVQFASVSFAYESEFPVLRDVSFEVAEGQRVGIAGRSGAGKSTVMHLLTRFFDPTTGSITLDGLDLRDYKVADLRKQYAIVLQEPVLFSTSVGENIAYARPEATADEIVAAARAANAHEFILALPDGYETLVRERGMRLSGGERQRIALARAFLTDAPILLLDEPTSSVDVRTEAGIMEAMERLMQGRTTFMVAHRLSTLKSCDLLLRIDTDGSVRRVATHDEMELGALGSETARRGMDP